jgi:uncharacterized protein YcbK (DUF882 family)
MKLTKNFAKEELVCKDGTPVPDKSLGNATEICKRAQVLRDFLGTALSVNSGYRTEAHNTKIGGAKNSYHLTASALDLHCTEWDAELLADVYQGLINIGAVPDGGLGRYPNFVHIDIGRPRRWKKTAE